MAAAAFGEIEDQLGDFDGRPKTRRIGGRLPTMPTIMSEVRVLTSGLRLHVMGLRWNLITTWDEKIFLD